MYSTWRRRQCLTLRLFHVIRNSFSSFCKIGRNRNKNNSLWSLFFDFKVLLRVMPVKKSIHQKVSNLFNLDQNASIAWLLIELAYENCFSYQWNKPPNLGSIYFQFQHPFLIIKNNLALLKAFQHGSFRDFSWVVRLKILPFLKSVTHILQWWNLA